MRKTIFLVVPLAGAMALGACAKEEPAPVGTDTATETISPPVWDGDPEKGDSVAESAIPAALHGRWGLVPADCTSSAGDAKGLLTITADRLQFYESVAELETVQSVSADSIEGKFAFTGEGQNWTLDVALSSADGTTLIRKDSGPDAIPSPLTYTRCS